MAAPCETVCDGAAVPYLTQELYPALASLVDRTVLVPDEKRRPSRPNLQTQTYWGDRTKKPAAAAAARSRWS